MKKTGKQSESIRFRHKAEALLKEKALTDRSQLSDADIIKLIHEIEVYQIELELQNEDLINGREQIKAAVDRYTELYDFAPTGYFTLSEEGKILELNLSGARMLGKERRKLINSHFAFFISLDTRPSFNDFFLRVNTSGVKETCEVRLNTRNDEPVYVHIEGILSENGKVCHVTVVDISETKLAVKSLELLNRQKNLILQAAGEGILGIDINGIQTFVNPMASEILGYTAEELLGKNSHMVFHHHYQDGALYPAEKCPIYATMQTGSSNRGEEYFWRKDGTGFPIEYSSLPIIEDGRITGAVITFRDITERKNAEQNLLQSEERYKSLFQDNYSVMLLIDPESGDIKDANPSACQYYGWSHAEICSRNISDINTMTQAEVDSALKHAKTEKIRQFEFKHHKASGEVRDVEVYSGPISFGDTKLLYSIIHDITERKQAEESIKESRQKLAFANNQLIMAQYVGHTGSWFYDLKTQKLTGTEEAYHLFGLDKDQEDFDIESIEACIPEKERVHQALIDLIQNGIPYDVEYVVHPADGSSPRTVISKAILEKNPDGNSLALIGVIQDITERKQSEQILNARLRLTEFSQSHTRNELQQKLLDELELLTDSRIGFFHSIDSDQNSLTLQSWSTNTLQNMCKADARGQHYPIDKAGVWVDCFHQRKAVIHNDYMNLPGRHGLPDGHAPVIREMAVPVFRNDLIVAIVGLGNKPGEYVENDIEVVSLLADMAWDITERKGAEEALVESEAKLNHAQEIARMGNWELDLVTNNVTWSKNYFRILGMQPDARKLSKDDFMKIVHPGDIHLIDEIFREINKNRKPESVDIRLTMPDGSIKWVQNTIVPRYDRDNLVSLSGVNIDISEKKLAEMQVLELNAGLERKIKERTAQLAEANEHLKLEIEERQQSEEKIKEARNEAEQANLAKSEFLSRMSHELRTPMNSILGFAQLMQMQELGNAQKKGVSHILTSGKHLLHLINEILDISRIEAGRIVLSMEPVQLYALIMETIDVVHPEAAKRNLNMDLEPSPANQFFVKADPQRLKQVLLNLVNNAIKYNREEGWVIIKTEQGPTHSDGTVSVRISITDTGIGISVEDIPKLSQPFERIGAAKSEIEGTGLGLTVVKKLMEAMGGTFGVDSTLGEGSTFWIELPMASQPVLRNEWSADISKQKESNTGQSGTILYIEDNISNSELVQEILQNHRPEIRVITSPSGKLALEEAAGLIPDLILLDLDLPDMNGSEVFDALKAGADTCAIPVVIISADAMPQQIEKLMLAGARDYLTKPLNITEFLTMIDEWF